MIRHWLRSISNRIPLKKIDLLIRGCNLHCPMCSMNANSLELPQVLRDYPGAFNGPELTLEEHKTAFQSLGHWRPIVSIGGGEPMTFPPLIELIVFLKREMGFQVGLTTNGTLFNDDKIRAFIDTGASITVSIDGMEETHDRIRGTGVFKRAIGLLKELIELRRLGKYRGSIYSLFAFQQENYREVLEVACFLLEQIGIDSLTISFLVFSTPEILAKHHEWAKARGLPATFDINISRGGVISTDLLRKMDLVGMWEKKQIVEAKYSKVRFEPEFKSFENLKQYFLTDDVMSEYFGRFCRPANQELVLLSNGDTLFFPGCFQIKLGNVREMTLREIWYGEKLKVIRKVLSSDLPPICSHCCANRVEKHLSS